LFTGGTDAPLSPSPEYFSVKGGAKPNHALRCELGPEPFSPPAPPVNKFSFRPVSWFVLKSPRGVVLCLPGS